MHATATTMSSLMVSLAQQEIAALADYFKSVTAAGSLSSRRRGKPGKLGKPQVCKRASGSRWTTLNTVSNAHEVPPQVGEFILKTDK